MEDPELLKRVREMTCVACDSMWGRYQRYPTEAHHVTTRGAGGGDREDNVMPLCTFHHREWHKSGPGSMVRKYQTVLDWLEKWDRRDVLERIRRV